MTGEPKSLDFRVQFHYNDHGQLKQISPWHDIPLFSPDGFVHMVTESPCTRASNRPCPSRAPLACHEAPLAIGSCHW